MLSVQHIDGEHIRLDAATHEPARQRVTSRLIAIEGDRVKQYPIELRCAWPSELDLMAQLAGLRLRERWGGWRREPFGGQSMKHVSVYAQ